MLAKKLTKKVYCIGYWWKVERVFSPTKYDDYILISRKDENTCHDDGTVPVEMALIDCHNDEFYPDTRKVREALAWLKPGIDPSREARDEAAKKTLTHAWLDHFDFTSGKDEGTGDDGPGDY